MAKLADVTFEGAALPTGVTAVVSGGGTVALEAGGLPAAGTSTQHLSVLVPLNGTAYANVDLAAVGAGVGLVRGFGFHLRINARTSGSPTRVVTVRGNNGAAFLCMLGYAYPNWTFQYEAGNPTTVINLPLATFVDGQVYEVFIGVQMSPAAAGGRYLLIVDGAVLHDSGAVTNSAEGYGAGVSHVRLGEYVASTGGSLDADYDALYVTDALEEARSSEVPAAGAPQTLVAAPVAATAVAADAPVITGDAPSDITGYDGPLGPSVRTVQLATTAPSPVWASDDADVMTVDATGLVTLRQAAGGIATITDGSSSVDVEFQPRDVAFAVGQSTQTGSGTGSTLETPITLAGADPYGDGAAAGTYTDVVPAVQAATGVTLGSVVETTANQAWLATFTATAAAPPYEAWIDGALVDIAAAAPITLGAQAGGAAAGATDAMVTVGTPPAQTLGTQPAGAAAAAADATLVVGTPPPLTLTPQPAAATAGATDATLTTGAPPAPITLTAQPAGATAGAADARAHDPAALPHAYRSRRTSGLPYTARRTGALTYA